MAGTQLDGAGMQKVKTLEDALTTLQSIHGMVERMAMDVKNRQPTNMLPQQIKRIATPLQGQLKGQFGMIADLVSALILAAGRGGNEAVKVRTMRESVAHVRTALEIAMTKVKDQHTIRDDAKES